MVDVISPSALKTLNERYGDFNNQGARWFTSSSSLCFPYRHRSQSQRSGSFIAVVECLVSTLRGSYGFDAEEQAKSTAA